MYDRMYRIEELVTLGILPPQLAKMLKDRCPEDGCPIVRNENLTKTQCSNPDCRLHIQHRADKLLKHLNLTKDIGPATCLHLMRHYKLKDQFEVMNFVLKNIKGEDFRPSVHLYEIAQFSYPEGISTELENELAGYFSFEEYFEKCQSPHRSLLTLKRKLIKAQDYFIIKPPQSRYKLEVMITGSLRGYKRREDFIAMLNNLAGSLVRIVPKGPKQSADYLITDNKEAIMFSMQNGSMNRKATATSKSGGRVQVVTSAEFIKEYHNHVKAVLGKT